MPHAVQPQSRTFCKSDAQLHVLTALHGLAPVGGSLSSPVYLSFHTFSNNTDVIYWGIDLQLKMIAISAASSSLILSNLVRRPSHFAVVHLAIATTTITTYSVCKSYTRDHAASLPVPILDCFNLLTRRRHAGPFAVSVMRCTPLFPLEPPAPSILICTRSKRPHCQASARPAASLQTSFASAKTPLSLTLSLRWFKRIAPRQISRARLPKSFLLPL